MSMSDIFLPEKLERELQKNGLDVENFYARVLMYRAGQYPTNNLVSASPMEGIANFSDIKSTAETIGIETIKSAKVAFAIINGGMATRFGGEVKGIAEWFTLPYNMQFENLKHINTNNIWVDLRRLYRPLPLHWYVVEKTVNGDLIVQFERLIAQYSWYCDCTILQVPQCHFIPAKTKQQIIENSGFYKDIIAEFGSF